MTKREHCLVVSTEHVGLSQLVEYFAFTSLGAKVNRVLGLILYLRASGSYHKQLSIRNF